MAVVAGMMMAAFCAGAKDAPSPEVRVMQDASRFTMVFTKREIPHEVFMACAEAVHVSVFAMADPGKPFQASDAVTDTRLPWRRLIWAAKGPGCWVVHYEKGGYAHLYFVVLVQDDAKKARGRVTWTGMPFGPLKDYEEFARELKNGRVTPSAHGVN